MYSGATARRTRELVSKYDERLKNKEAVKTVHKTSLQTGGKIEIRETGKRPSLKPNTEKILLNDGKCRKILRKWHPPFGIYTQKFLQKLRYTHLAQRIHKVSWKQELSDANYRAPGRARGRLGEKLNISPLDIGHKWSDVGLKVIINIDTNHRCLYSIYIFKILLLVFKALNGQEPIYLAEMLVPCSNSEHDLRSSYDNLLVVPATDSATYGDRAFSVLGPSLWNNLPKKIRCSSSVPSFKSALKTHLFKQSFGVLTSFQVNIFS